MPEEYQEDDKTRTHVILTKGTMVSHYRIIEKIGAGGMGEVYLAEDTKLQRQVALKFLPQHLVVNDDAKARFTREAQAAAKLSHPNIVTIHEVSEYQGRPFFAMQHVQGQSLRDLVRDKELSLDKVIAIAIQVCEGLSKAHQTGITHRDVKPSNIVVDADGRPKLLDFGLAAVEGSEKLTKTGSTLGTTGYMSPEQARGEKVDQRSDIFSLGIVLYEMITGRRPFRGEDAAATLHAITHDTPEPLARYKVDVPDELQQIVDRALEKDVETRYQTTSGMLADLKRLAAAGSGKPLRSPARVYRRRLAASAALLVILVGAWFVLFRPFGTGRKDTTRERIMLAVLPFKNLGPAEQEYFADGVTDEIITRFASVSGVGVISRTSAMTYKNTDKSLRQIGRELGVEYILEGTIRWDKSDAASRVRISPQLVCVKDDVPLWAQSYDRILDQIFAIQSDIAQRILSSLSVTLLPVERKAISEVPTQNLDAYDLYLRGNYVFYQGDYTRESFAEAERLYKAAIAGDSQFAQAYAILADVYMTRIWHRFDRLAVGMPAARQLLDQALRLRPDLPEAHSVLGGYYAFELDDIRMGLEHLLLALEVRPHDVVFRRSRAFIYRKLGEFQQSTAILKDVLSLDPLNWRNPFEIAYNLVQTRHYDEAEIWFDSAVALRPSAPVNYYWKMYLSINRDGNVAGARQALNEAKGKVSEKELVYEQVSCDVLEGKYESALARLPEIVTTWWWDSSDYYLNKAHIYQYMDQKQPAAAYYDSARILLERWIAEYPPELRTPAIGHYHAYLGIAFAGLGRKEDAIREGQKALELTPLKTNGIYGAYVIQNMAQILTMMGETDAAIAQIDYLLSIPNCCSIHWFRLHPLYAPLRDHPRFKALLEKYEKKHGI